VGESVAKPDLYYGNNVGNTLVLLQAMQRHGVRKFIFSSTAAVYGEPNHVPIDESHPKQPINPYGRSKWMIEQVLDDFQAAFGFQSVCLRYFNAAGADPKGELGERHTPETHLIPLVLQAASGRRPFVSVFGSDYDTPDGTCIRDYIHVQDLCGAHKLALDHLLAGGLSKRFNLGNSQGFSVNEVIETARLVTGRPIDTRYERRRPGDPPRLVASSALIREELRWSPQYADLAIMIEHAWKWECLQ
jgi:UDP-glucose 4-epimerase